MTVLGDHRLDHLLVCLSPDDKVPSPPDYDERRQARARELLVTYE